MVSEQGVRFIAAANHWVGREGQTPRYIIIHGTAGGSSALAIANYFAQPSTQASAHYVIGRDGTIVCAVSEENAAWSNGVITGPQVSRAMASATAITIVGGITALIRIW